MTPCPVMKMTMGEDVTRIQSKDGSIPGQIPITLNEVMQLIKVHLGQARSIAWSWFSVEPFSVMFRLKIRENKGNTQHCLKPCVGRGREQGEGPAVVRCLRLPQRNRAKRVLEDSSRSKHVLIVVSHSRARGWLGHQLVTLSGQWDAEVAVAPAPASRHPEQSGVNVPWEQGRWMQRTWVTRLL